MVLDAEIAGHIEFDVTFLKDDKIIETELGETKITRGKRKRIRRRLWRITATLIVIVDGRNFRYEIRMPHDYNKVYGKGEVSLAAAFRPGTD
jgi:hypothetical protein